MIMKKNSPRSFTKPVYVLALLGFFYTAPATAPAQDWPESAANRQIEFEMDERNLPATEEPETPEITRGQVTETRNLSEPTISDVLKRDIINPFDTEQKEASPVMQMLPEDIIVPDLPDLEIQQQINLDEFRNYLNTLVENPPQRAKAEFSEEEIRKQLNKIKIDSLMTTPNSYVVINEKRFKIGDRFSMPVNIPSKGSGMENLIEEQMPEEGSVPEDIYQQFLEVKEEALEKYRRLEAQRQSETSAGTHNISVIINDIQHRRLVVSVGGDEYAIPIKMAL